MRILERRGLTVIELMLALLLIGLMGTIGHALLSTLSDATIRTTRRAADNELRGAGLARLREYLVMVEPVTAHGRPFMGDERSASFTTRCRTGGGWLARCRVDLQLVPQGKSWSLEASENGGGWTPLMRVPGDSGRFAYLDATDEYVWRARWGTSIAPPGAFRVVVGDNVFALPVLPR